MRCGRVPFTAILLLMLSVSCGDSITQPSAATDTCDPVFWNHVWGPDRLTIVDRCRTVTGTVSDMHTNEDGDFDIRLALDPQFSSLLNALNISQLNGHLQLEAICQAPILTADALQACGSFRSNILLPSVGQRISATGTYVLDTNHGWMELHPLSVVRILQP